MIKVIISLIKIYRSFSGILAQSPLLLFPSHCRYYPTCSEYAMEAVKKYGAW